MKNNFKPSSAMLRADLVVAFAIMAFAGMLVVLPLLLSEQKIHSLFSEQGPFELLAILGWLFTALLIVLRIRPFNWRAGAFAALCLVFAAREADWHKEFTAASMLKTGYYRDTVAPFPEKLIAGMVAALLVVLLLYVGFVVARFLFRQGGWRSRAGLWLLIGTALVVIGKIIDRAPATLEVDYGIILPPLLGLYAGVFEEGLEMIHPLILAWSVWISQTENSYLSSRRTRS